MCILPVEITAISLPLPYRTGNVNCYLLRLDNGNFILIDSGGANARQQLLAAIKKQGCYPGHLKLVILTHGDFDHSGNAACLRENYRSTIAIHAADAGMIKLADIYYNRKRTGWLLSFPVKPVPAMFFGFGKKERLTPDLLIKEETDLSLYGLDAAIIHLPGHSRGSVGVLVNGRVLFCGDLLVNEDNTDKPKLNRILDDRPAALASLHKLIQLNISKIYPGHGRPFPPQLVKSKTGTI